MKVIITKTFIMAFITAIILLFIVKPFIQTQKEGYRAPDNTTQNLDIYFNSTYAKTAGWNGISTTPNQTNDQCKTLLLANPDAKTAWKKDNGDCILYKSANTDQLEAGAGRVFMKKDLVPAPEPTTTTTPPTTTTTPPTTTTTPPTTTTTPPTTTTTPQVMPYDITKESAFLSDFDWMPNKNTSTLTASSVYPGKKGSECANTCDTDDSCQAFVYNKGNNTCSTYSEREPTLVDNTVTDYFNKLTFTEKHKTGLIVGGVVGTLGLIGVIILIIVIIKRRKSAY